MALLSVENFGTIFQCRPGTFDEGIIKKYIACYFKIMGEGHPDETWLDIGAHIGGFSAVIAPQVQKVIAIEANPETAKILEMNTAHLPNVEVLSAAVVGTKEVELMGQTDTRETVVLYQTATGQFGKQNAQDSLVRTRGRVGISVPAVTLNSLLAEKKNVGIKMDIEGAERQVIDSIHDWSNIKRFMLEFHTFHHVKPLHVSDRAYYDKVMRLFRENFRAVVSTLPEGTAPWTWYVYGEK